MDFSRTGDRYADESAAPATAAPATVTAAAARVQIFWPNKLHQREPPSVALLGVCKRACRLNIKRLVEIIKLSEIVSIL